MALAYTVYQIILDDETVAQVNKDGWGSSNKASAYAKALSFGDPTTGLKHGCYTKVAEIIADDLDHVFEIGNGVVPCEEGRMRRYAKMTSISVGNIIGDDFGRRWVVSPFGFTPVEEAIQQYAT